MNQTSDQKSYRCHECTGLQRDCEDYTPRQKEPFYDVCIWKEELIPVRVRGEGRVIFRRREEKDNGNIN